jgi:hypothetical protein
LLDSRVLVNHHSGRIIVLVIQPPPSVVAGNCRGWLADLLAGLVAVSDRARRRRSFVASTSRRSVQGICAPVQPIVDAKPTAAGALHSARQQQRVDEKHGVRWALGTQRLTHAQFHAHDHQKDEETVEFVQPVQER